MKALTLRNLLFSFPGSSIVIFLFCCLTSCSKYNKRTIDGQEYTVTKVDSTSNLYLESNDFNGVIFCPDSTTSYKKEFKEFIPTVEEIFKAERIFQRCLNIDKMGKDSISIDRGRLLPVSRYYRQYVGTYNEQGQKIITLNCFDISWLGTDNKWKKHQMEVRDGGNSFFSIDINITTEDCYGFMVNSRA